MKKIFSFVLIFLLVISSVFQGEILAMSPEFTEIRKESLEHRQYFTQVNHDDYWANYTLKSGVPHYFILMPMKNIQREDSPKIRSIKFDKNIYNIGDSIEVVAKISSKRPMEKLSIIYELPSEIGYLPMKFTKKDENTFVFKGKISSFWEIGEYKIARANKGYYITGYDTKGTPVVVDNYTLPTFKVRDPKNKQKPLESLTGKKTNVYVSRGANLRTFYGDIYTNVSSGEALYGYDMVDYVLFFMDGKALKANKKFVRKASPERTFYSRGANIRDLSGEKYGYSFPGRRIKGNQVGDKIYFLFEGEFYTVSRAFMDRNGESRIYTSKGVNVRNSGGRKLGYLKSGKKIKGKRNGFYIDVVYKGKAAKINSKFLY